MYGCRSSESARSASRSRSTPSSSNSAAVSRSIPARRGRCRRCRRKSWPFGGSPELWVARCQPPFQVELRCMARKKSENLCEFTRDVCGRGAGASRRAELQAGRRAESRPPARRPRRARITWTCASSSYPRAGASAPFANAATRMLEARAYIDFGRADADSSRVNIVFPSAFGSDSAQARHRRVSAILRDRVLAFGLRLPLRPGRKGWSSIRRHLTSFKVNTLQDQRGRVLLRATDLPFPPRPQDRAARAQGRVPAEHVPDDLLDRARRPRQAWRRAGARLDGLPAPAAAATASRSRRRCTRT